MLYTCDFQPLSCCVQDPTDLQLQSNAVNLIKFFERLYKTLPQFSLLASSHEFVEALVAALFPPDPHQVAASPVSGSCPVEEGELVSCRLCAWCVCVLVRGVCLCIYLHTQTTVLQCSGTLVSCYLDTIALLDSHSLSG